LREVLSGNQAAAIGAKLARAQVICAYPITPQTGVVESLADFVADGELDAEFINAESEHSALSICVGASATGARAFTATSSQGLALMNEVLYIASGMRLPIVMTVANRSLSAPLSIWCDWQDSISVRDSGWIQLYCENNQEILDSVLIAYRAAEEVLLPVMVCYDGFILSHTYELVDVAEQAEVDSFLPPYKFPYPLDPDRPITMGAFASPEWYQEFRNMSQEAVRGAKQKLAEVQKSFGNRFGRRYGLIERYRSDDADVILLTMGSLSGSSKVLIDRCREGGESVGLVRLRVFRPFPAEELVEALAHAKVVAVLEKDISLGWTGALYTDIAGAFANEGVRPLMLDFICGLGGRDVTLPQIDEALKMAARSAKEGRVRKAVHWLGLREDVGFKV